ncbi:hypothetical protein H2200_005655 [Cladophialophora chaetospira]|uniref:Ribonuclease H2 subunit B n=1 Tax=Cladophialophora chaetospira TaxID=386627 RepID=A0AA38XCE2_9EURO|nr:hypothetical protein H2200_005655 [Cladophialophora chaetospira]
MVTVTRSSSRSPTKKPSIKPSNSMDTPQDEPSKHFLLPKDISSQARFMLLRHPRDSSVQRFLFCPDKGLFQFTRVSAPSADPRSLLFTPSLGIEEQQSEGCISKNADFFVATVIDMAFFLIPLVISTKAPTGKTLFQPIDDLFEEHMREEKALRYLVENGRAKIEEAMSRFCDTIDAGDEQMYRPNEEKTLRMLLGKVDTVIKQGLPSTLEEKFVTRALEAPILSVKREETTISAVKVKTRAKAPDEECDDEDSSDAFDSQSSDTSTAPSTVFSEVSIASSVSTTGPETIPLELLQLQKQRIVLDFILVSYVPDAIADRLRARLASKKSTVNFAPLEEHLRSLAILRAEVLSSRSISDFSRKRGLEDDETAELRAEKKRRQEEEDRKKRLGESNGIRALKKVNVAGMKKMSDFFSKKPASIKR